MSVKLNYQRAETAVTFVCFCCLIAVETRAAKDIYERRENMTGSLLRSTRKGIILTIALFLSFITISLYAQPVVTAVRLIPSAPGFGEAFTLEVDFCAQRHNAIVMIAAVSTSSTFQNAQLSGAGQVFVVTRRPGNPHVAAANPGEDFGLIVRGNWGGSAPANCSYCTAADGTTATARFNLTMPQREAFPGCNVTDLNMLIRLRDSNMSEGDWQGAANTCPAGSDRWNSTAWQIPLVPAFANIQKKADGVLQVANDLLLYQIDYQYANQRLTITDPIPGGGNFTLVQAGPMGIWTGTPPIGSTSGTLTWVLPDRTGQRGVAEGTVWFLLRMNTNIADGTVIPNTATGTGTVSGVTSSLTRITKGQPVINITKSQRSDSVPHGTNVTYYLEYSINGSKLVAYQPFDDMATGVYAGASPPTNWRFSPSPLAANQSWEIFDECGTGDRQVRGHSPNLSYPNLLYDGLGTAFCTGIIVSDIKITASYEGADALIHIRNNGINGVGSIAYSLGISVDRNFGSNPNGFIGFQRCVTTAGPTSSCIWPASADPGIGKIETNRWYTVKVEALSDYQFRAKVWAKGEPEPANWDVTWTDPTPPANSSCASGMWYTGYGQQGGDSGWVRDIYNNFVIYEPRVSANTRLYDTIPAGIIYQGYQGPLAPSSTTPLLNWNLGTISNEGGTYTWWARVDTCDPITNRATIAGTGVAPVDSNIVITMPICREITGVTKTANVTSASIGQTITWTVSWCNNGMSTVTNYRIFDTIPAGLGYTNCAGGTSCSRAGSIITWNIGNVAPGACGSVTWWGPVVGPFGFMPELLFRQSYARANISWAINNAFEQAVLSDTLPACRN